MNIKKPQPTPRKVRLVIDENNDLEMCYRVQIFTGEVLDSVRSFPYDDQGLSDASAYYERIKKRLNNEPIFEVIDEHVVG